MEKIKAYYALTKPGLVRGNLILTAAGFLFAAHGHITLQTIVLLLATLIGIFFVIASGCVFNNYIDRNIDRQMARTKDRALVMGTISGQHALIYAAVLGILGILTLVFFTNVLTLSLALIGFIFYVLLYTPMKHYSAHAALIGSLSGAVPIVVGYCAVTNNFDIPAALLFLMLIFWQMPHFYAIAIYRLNEYQAAHVPVFPLEKGIFKTKIYILLYIIFFSICCFLLFFWHFAGTIFGISSGILCLIWLSFSISGFTTTNDSRWARTMFFLSLIVIMSLSVLLALRM